MCLQGFCGAPNGLPQLPQQSLFRPPPGLAIPPSMQPMQFSSFNLSLPMEASCLPSFNFLEYHSSLVPNSTVSVTLISTSLSSSLSLNVHPLHPVPPTPETSNLLPNKAPISAIPTSTLTSNLQLLSPFSGLAPDNAGLFSVANKPTIPGPGVDFSSVTNKPTIPGPGVDFSSVANKPTIPGPVPLTHPTISQPLTSVALASGSSFAETSTPSHITPRQLQQCGQTIVSSPLPLLTTQKDVKVVQVLPQTSSELLVPAVTEAQPPILPLLPNTRAHKPNDVAHPLSNNYGGHDGQGSGTTEEFDFKAMNEKFNKDEVWGHLGKSNQSQSKDKVVNESLGDEYDSPDDYDAELSKIEIKPVYKKDDFFDSFSCNALDNNPNYGRTRYSEQVKLDSETFGDFSRYWDGRGSVQGGGGGGGRFHGSYYGGRGYGGYGLYG